MRRIVLILVALLGCDFSPNAEPPASARPALTSGGDDPCPDCSEYERRERSAQRNEDPVNGVVDAIFSLGDGG